MPETQKQFNKESFEAEFGELFATWRACWVSEKTGPFRIIQGGANISAERLRLEQPEQDALNTLVEYAATAIAIASLVDQEKEAIQALVFAYRTNDERRVAEHFYPDFFGKVFARTLEILKEEGKGVSQRIGDIAAKQRGIFQRTLNFGFAM